MKIKKSMLTRSSMTRSERLSQLISCPKKDQISDVEREFILKQMLDKWSVKDEDWLLKMYEISKLPLFEMKTAIEKMYDDAIAKIGKLYPDV